MNGHEKQCAQRDHQNGFHNFDVSLASQYFKANAFRVAANQQVKRGIRDVEVFDGQLVKISRKSRVRESNRSFLRALTFVELVFSCFFLRTLPGNILGELLVSYRISRIVTPAQLLQLMNGGAP